MTPAESEHREVRMWFKGTQQAVAALDLGQVSSPPGIAQPPGSSLAQSGLQLMASKSRGRFALPTELHSLLFLGQQ